MKAKSKNWIVFCLQLQFFSILTFVIVFLEFVWLYEVFFYPLNFPFPVPPSHPPVPSNLEIFISIVFVSFVILNLSMAIFSIYAFIFILHVLDTNPAKTAPVCAISIDFALINIFFYQHSLYKDHYSTYFITSFPLSIYFLIPNLIAQISEILLIIAFFSIFINLEFGIEGILKRHIINSNKMTDFIHYILITNGIIGILYIYPYIGILNVSIIGILASVILAIFFFGLFNFVLRKLNLNNYPIEALARWKYGGIVTKKDNGQKN